MYVEIQEYNLLHKKKINKKIKQQKTRGRMLVIGTKIIKGSCRRIVVSKRSLKRRIDNEDCRSKNSSFNI